MVRPLRIEYPGALYHITSRGDGRDLIFLSDRDRLIFMDLIGELSSRFQWLIYAYCLMDNHYHLLAETQEANLCRGMRHLNGVYTQRFNRFNHRVGHVFQGRYKAILVQKETYFRKLVRYIVLNPVRAGMVSDPTDWPWSSHRAVLGTGRTQAWLCTEQLLSHFGEGQGGLKRYCRFVYDSSHIACPWEDVQHQVYLGDECFSKDLKMIANCDHPTGINRAQRGVLALSLNEYKKKYADPIEAMVAAYHSGVYTMREIGDFFGVHYMTVSRAVNQRAH
ncbi:MAG: transposase [Mariprofundus sp.]